MGESSIDRAPFDWNRSIELDASDESVSADAGALLMRETNALPYIRIQVDQSALIGCDMGESSLNRAPFEWNRSIEIDGSDESVSADAGALLIQGNPILFRG